MIFIQIWVNKFPELESQINQMCLLDFITRQDDRHLSNIAILMRNDTRSFYPFYDNGRSLFYEDSEVLVEETVKDIPAYATNFGEAETYYDVVRVDLPADSCAEKPNDTRMFGKLNHSVNI